MMKRGSPGEQAWGLEDVLVLVPAAKEPQVNQEQDPIKRALEQAISESEAGFLNKKALLEARRSCREELLEHIRDLHDGLLRLDLSGHGGDYAELQRRVRERFRELLGELGGLLFESPGDFPGVLARGNPKMSGEQLVADGGPGVLEVRAMPLAAGPSPVPSGAPDRKERAPGPGGGGRQGVEQALKPIYQEILTLEENQVLFEDKELHRRIQLILARLRRVQDGPLSKTLDENQQSFMRSRFGLLENLQKLRQLDYLETLNRQFQTSWDDYIAKLEQGLLPLAERIAALQEKKALEKSRKQAALEQRARRRLEGEEILDALRLRVRDPALEQSEGVEPFRGLVREAMVCLAPRYDSLLEVVEPWLKFLGGKEFKSLRKASSRRHGAGLEPATPPPSPTPSQEADREERLKGAWRGCRALLLGGQYREKAEEILKGHLGLREIIWVSSDDMRRQGPNLAEKQLGDPELDLALLFPDTLGEALARRLEQASGARLLVKISGGQEISRILARLPLLEDQAAGEPSGGQCVKEIIERIQKEHQDAIVFAFNNASMGLDSPYMDGRRLYQALKFLATTYREARLGRLSCPDLDEACRMASGFQYRAHQAASTTGRYLGEYQTTFEGHRYALNEHVGRGVNRDPRLSIRVAFTFLPREEKVLVGYLGQHQKTTAS